MAATNAENETQLINTPLKNSGSIDYLEYTEVSPIIGREYATAKLKDILYAENSEQQIRDLAITICERGVVFFRAPQDDLSVEEQKKITELLGSLTTRPKEHGLHVWPLFKDPDTIPMKDGTKDKNIYVINSEYMKTLAKTMSNKTQSANEPVYCGSQWHTDCMWERCPADFSFLRMQDSPKSGGDTLWINCYELYDRISPPFRKFLESLTATCHQDGFENAPKVGGYEVMSPRGAPLNAGPEFSPIHPVVRTHPVTGWKSLYAGAGIHVTKINGLYKHEDEIVRNYISRLVTRNHDYVARFHWTEEAVAIWSNTCTMHAGTPDTHILGGKRTGARATGIGEVPYLDPKSKTRREALGLGIK